MNAILRSMSLFLGKSERVLTYKRVLQACFIKALSPKRVFTTKRCEATTRETSVSFWCSEEGSTIPTLDPAKPLVKLLP